jgi:hypothetical protein
MALEALKQARNGATNDNETRSDLSARAKSPEGMLGIYARDEGDEADSIGRLRAALFWPNPTSRSRKKD